MKLNAEKKSSLAHARARPRPRPYAYARTRTRMHTRYALKLSIKCVKKTAKKSRFFCGSRVCARLCMGVMVAFLADVVIWSAPIAVIDEREKANRV